MSFPAKRRDELVGLLKKKRQMRLDDLSQALGVSTMTIRRDLEHLERLGVIQKTYGGVVYVDGAPDEDPFDARFDRKAREKRLIGRVAAAQIEQEDIVLFDVGTTTCAIVEHLDPGLAFTALTNSLTIARRLARLPLVTVVVVGGVLRRSELSLTGEVAVENIARFRVNKGFLGTGGLTLDRGLTNYDQAEAEVRREMMRISQRVIVVADHSKFGAQCFVQVAPLSAVDTLITDQGTPQDVVTAIRDSGVDVIVAEP
jgi:DeoR/GlpR family transcriptional regulator of sugar metabolism